MYDNNARTFSKASNTAIQQMLANSVERLAGHPTLPCNKCWPTMLRRLATRPTMIQQMLANNVGTFSRASNTAIQQMLANNVGTFSRASNTAIQRMLERLAARPTLPCNKCLPTMFGRLAGRPTLPSNKCWPTMWDRLAGRPTLIQQMLANNVGTFSHAHNTDPTNVGQQCWNV